MKKLALVLLGVLALCVCSCERRAAQVMTTDLEGYAVYGRRFELDGHTYIEFWRSRSGTYDAYTGYEHDPECLINDLKNAKYGL
jgi:hypothetical protein